MVKLAAKRLSDLVADGCAVTSAAERVLDELGGGAGLIAIDAGGTVVATRRTPFMAAARRG